MNVNGARVRDNNFYLDGAFDNSLFRNGGNHAPNPDAVEEFRLITSNFDAEYGRLPGSVMNVVTRSVAMPFRALCSSSSAMTRSTLATSSRSAVTALKRNQFGFSFGGPIWKDKTFFFASYQGLRLRTDSTGASHLPRHSASAIFPGSYQPSGPLILRPVKPSYKFGGSLLWNHLEETGNWLGAGQIRFNGAFTKNAHGLVPKFETNG